MNSHRTVYVRFLVGLASALVWLHTPDAHATSCTDAIKNGLETDVDCGGPSCPRCAGGHECLSSPDCASSVCINGHCAAVSCSDYVKNGDETDVDCGGSKCPACVTPCTCAAQSD